jgi:hypothetical protein
MTLFRLIAGATLMLAATASHALDFKSVGANPAILYDAPSTKGGKLFVASGSRCATPAATWPGPRPRP